MILATRFNASNAYLPCLLVLFTAALHAGCSDTPDGANGAAAVGGGDAGVTILSDVSGGGGSDGGDAGGDPATVGLVYIASRGVSTPWLIGVGAQGALPPRQLGPRRGAGYGLGEGEVSYPDITPDGKTVVVVFYTMDTPASKSAKSVPILFALPMDGSGATKPVRIATASALHAVDRAYTNTHVAYIDGSALYVARLDGGDANAPLLVAQGSAAVELSVPRWLPDGKRLAYVTRPVPGGGTSKLFLVAADGSQASQPQPVLVGGKTPSDGSAAEYLAAILPDGTLIARGADDRLYRAAGPGVSVPLTPKGAYVTSVGLNKQGDRLAVVLRSSSQGARRLVTVATNGSDAGAPHELTEKPAQKLSVLVSRDAAAVAWVADDGAGKWAVWQAGFGASASARRLTTWQTSQLYVTAYDHAAGVLLGVRSDGAVLRFRLDAATPQPPHALAKVDDVVNGSIPWPVLSATATHVLFDANTKTGWHGWTLALTGVAPQQHLGPWYRKLVTPWGFLTHEYVYEEAGFVVDATLPVKTPRQLTPWRNAVMTNAVMTNAVLTNAAIEPASLSGPGAHLLFARETPTPGWYAAGTKPLGSAGASSGAAPNPATLVMPRPSTLLDHQNNAWLQPPAVVADHLVRVIDKQLLAFALNGLHAQQPRQIGGDGVSVWTHNGSLPGGQRRVVVAEKRVDTTTRVVSAVLPSGLSATPATAGVAVPVVPIMTLQGQVQRLVMLPNTQPAGASHPDRVAAVVQVGGATSVVAAAVDGSEHKAPLLLATGLPGWLLNLLPTPDGRLLLAVVSVEATAVPHPDLLLAMSATTSPSQPDKATYALAPKGFGLWGCGESACETATAAGVIARSPVTSVDGTRVVLRGPKGLVSARLDGADALNPTLLGPLTTTEHGWPQQVGDLLLLLANKALHISRIGAQPSQQQLTAADPGVVVSARWVQHGKRVVFLRGGTGTASDAARPFLIDANAKLGQGVALVGPTFGVQRLVAEVPVADVPGASHMLVESEQGGDHSLYLMSLTPPTRNPDGSAADPVAVTPIDDARERFIGFR